jgi:hypothetical protein
MNSPSRSCKESSRTGETRSTVNDTSNSNEDPRSLSGFSDYIIYVDESGDHLLSRYDPEFPVFVLSFCIFRKDDYVNQIVPGLQWIKINQFGHDMIVLHEREIRKASGPFAFLTDAARRERFMSDLSEWVARSPFAIIAVVIRKVEFGMKHSESNNPYYFAMRLGLERVDTHFQERDQQGRTTHVIFEARGRREDDDLELEFRRVCDGSNDNGRRLPLQFVLAPKSINSTGLQLADLTARPIGRHVMKPDQSNRAYSIIEGKLDRSSESVIEGYGLRIYP